MATSLRQTAMISRAGPVCAVEADRDRPKPRTAAWTRTRRKKPRSCERCPLYRDATQTVFGEGPSHARWSSSGSSRATRRICRASRSSARPGRLFDRALADAQIDRTRVYVTNAVKHFKFEPRGKRRMHQKPNNAEVEACRWWLDSELDLLRPQLTVALGATAARALTGHDVTISRAAAD